MKKLLNIIMCVSIICLSMLMTGCGGVDFYIYMYVNEYSVIGNNKAFEIVKEIEIDWLNGNVNIVKGDVDKVTLSESGENSYQYPAYCRLREDGHLNVKYLKSGEIKDTSLKKDLTITVPLEYEFVDISISAYESNVTVDGVACTDIEVKHMSSAVNIKNSEFDVAKVVTGSGTANIINCVVSDRLIINPNTGNVEVASCNVKNYKIYAYKGITTLVLREETFTIDIRDYGTCNSESFDLLLNPITGLYEYGMIPEDEEPTYTITFESTHTDAVLNLQKSVV